MKIVARKTKEKFYDSTEIDRTNAVYRLIIGQRSNGKTYNAIDKVLKAYFKENKPSVYIRRYAEDIKPNNMTDLIQPHINKIKKLSKGKYNSYELKTGAFRFTYVNEDGVKELVSEPFLYIVALSNWERSKGSDRAPQGIAYALFDEFLTRAKYLTNEFVLFTNVLSSFIRNRDGTIVYMLANTVAQFGNPYFLEMGLTDADTMQQGEVRLYTYNNEKLTVAIEYCAESEATKDVTHYYAFDNPSLSILTTGEWETESYRHWSKDLFYMNEDTFKFKCKLEFQGHKAVGEVHKTENDLIIYWHPLGKSQYKWTDKDLIYTDQPITNRHYSNMLTSVNTRKQSMVINIMKNHRDYYSDNTMGELIRAFVLWNGGK